MIGSTKRARWALIAVAAIAIVCVGVAWYPIARYGDAIAAVKASGGSVGLVGEDRRDNWTKRLAEAFSVPEYQLVYSLELSDSTSDEDLKVISVFADQLEHLALRSSLVTDQGLLEIAKCSHLTDLSLECPRITSDGTEAFGALNNLVRLQLTNGDVSGQGFRWLNRLPQLQYLQLSGIGVGQDGFDSWTGFDGLAELCLEDCEVDNVGVRQLSKNGFENVMRLSLAGNTKIDDEGVIALHFGFPSLRYLSLQGTGVSQEGAEGLRKSLPNVIIATDESIQERRALTEREEVASRELQRSPDRVDMVIQRGLARCELGKTEEAISDLSFALATTDSEEARFARAKCYAAARSYQDAERDLNVLLIRHPESQQYLMLRASVLVRLGRLDAALSDLDKLREAQPESADVRFDRAVVLGLLGRKSDAKAEWISVIERNAGDSSVYANLARILFEEGQWQEAVDNASKALEISPNNPSALLVRASSYERLGSSQAAEEDRQRIAEVSGQ
jgi:tetratricopeptide (TPR) repeat protein